MAQAKGGEKPLREQGKSRLCMPWRNLEAEIFITGVAVIEASLMEEAVIQCQARSFVRPCGRTRDLLRLTWDGDQLASEGVLLVTRAVSIESEDEV